MADCPICSKPEAEGFKPFCSKRCADIDLGRWLDEDYKISDGEDQSGGGIDGAPAAGDRS